MSSPLFVALSGPSGVGKDAVLNAMRASLDSAIHYAVTATTRPIRSGERDGVDYHFVSLERFQELRDRGELLEHAEVYGRWYGVPKAPLRDALAEGKDVILKVDVQGARTVSRLLPGALLIFLAPPSMEELERRLRIRKTESAEDMARRIETAREELAQAEHYHYVVENETDAVDAAVRRIAAIMAQEREQGGRPPPAL
ncbi:MAG: guanylate kinase [Chloroflexota bacterium]|nr:guanylate kinase [Chloroflexota bacterium]